MQYTLVYFCARAKSYCKRNHILFDIAALCISGAMWIGSLSIEGDHATSAQQYAKFGLWYGGIFIEVMAPFISMYFRCPVTRFQGSNLLERFSTLTLLILGEGVVGFVVALQKSTYPCFIEVPIPSCWRYRVHQYGRIGNFHDWFHHLFHLGVLFLHLP